MKKLLLLTVFLILKSNVYANDCLPARVEKDFPAQLATGAFMRFSPTAEHVIAWGQDSTDGSTGATFLVDLRGPKAKVIKTSLAVESYPVEGDWNLIGSASFNTSYYELSELLSGGIFKKAAFSAPVGGLYHVSGTLPSTDPNKKIVRTVSYDKLQFSDTEIQMKNGKIISHKPVIRDSRYLCSNLGKKGYGPEVMQMMLSKDGTELVGIPASFAGNLKLFKIKDDLTCSVEDIPISSQKPMFSHPVEGKKGYIAFHTSAEIGSQAVPFGQVSIYDRDLKKYLRASLPEDSVVSFSPGTLKDGRVVFIRSDGKDKAKLVIVDPYQMNPGAGVSCLKKSATSAADTSKKQEPTLISK